MITTLAAKSTLISECEFYQFDEDGDQSAFDPDGVHFQVIYPDGTTHTWTYALGVDIEGVITKLETGHYCATVPLGDRDGLWQRKWYCTGPAGATPLDPIKVVR